MIIKLDENGISAIIYSAAVSEVPHKYGQVHCGDWGAVFKLKAILDK